jgi:hypothetical protein
MGLPMPSTCHAGAVRLRKIPMMSRLNIIDAHGAVAIWMWNAASSNLATLVSSGLMEPGSVAVDGSGNVGNRYHVERTASLADPATFRRCRGA